MAKCGPLLLIFLGYLCCPGAGAPAEDTSAVMQIAVGVEPSQEQELKEIKLVAFSDVHGTQQQNQENDDLVKMDFDKDKSEEAIKYKMNSDLEFFLQSPAWQQIKDLTDDPTVWGVVYGGDGTTAYNPIYNPHPGEPLKRERCKIDHCQPSVAADLKRLADQIRQLGSGRHSQPLKRYILSGNHDACLSIEGIRRRNCDDMTKAVDRANDVINYIKGLPGVELMNKNSATIEFFKDKNQVQRYLCLSSTSPARAGSLNWPSSAGSQTWDHSFNGAFQYPQTGDKPDGFTCPKWEDKPCAVIQYHGAPGSPFVHFNPKFKWAGDDNCQPELREAVNRAKDATGHVPVVLAGHSHMSDFVTRHGDFETGLLSRVRRGNIRVKSTIGIGNYATAEAKKGKAADVPNVPFGNTAMKWNAPAKKEETSAWVGNHGKQGVRGWVPPIVVTCNKDGGDTPCEVMRAEPERQSILAAGPDGTRPDTKELQKFLDNLNKQ